eukprot:TRINITY_DN30858_c0_g1_i1.p1 TRINITY_DN30858_c0_g1~~TRINITY_DN30858_c0_g1_i1.p1  ORF type:complete len:283 (+),score=33.63 TRINITY_DN30858_c0_g1_i1:54-902(+)
MTMPQWIQLKGLEVDADRNGQIGENKGEREYNLFEVCLEDGVTVLVPEENMVRMTWVKRPDDKKVPEKYLVFNDSDGDEVVLQARKGLGKGQYAVEGVWRPEFTAVEVFETGRVGREEPHLRFHCGNVMKNVPVAGVTEKLAEFLKFARIPSSLQSFKAGDAVKTRHSITFVDGVVLPPATRATVLQLTSPSIYDICLPSGDRLDVDAVDLLPCRPLMPDVEVVLKREVTFKSGKNLPEGTLLIVKKRPVDGMVDVETDDSPPFVFEVSELWVRELEGERLE